MTKADDRSHLWSRSRPGAIPSWSSAGCLRRTRRTAGCQYHQRLSANRNRVPSQGVITKFCNDSSHRSVVVSPGWGKSGTISVRCTPFKTSTPRVVTRTVVVENSHPIGQRPNRVLPIPQIIPVHGQAEAVVAISTNALGIPSGCAVGRLDRSPVQTQ